MVAVTIDSGPVHATDRLDNVPQSKWHDLMLARRSYMNIHLSGDCRYLVEFVNDAKLMFDVLGFANTDDMIRNGYGLQPEEINLAVEWLKLNPPREPVPLDEAVRLGKHGINQHTRGDSNTTSSIGRGRAYTLARLDRADAKDLERKGMTPEQFTDLAASVRAGEMSANAAAIEAGFRKKPVKRCPKCGHEW